MGATALVGGLLLGKVLLETEMMQDPPVSGRVCCGSVGLLRGAWRCVPGLGCCCGGPYRPASWHCSACYLTHLPKAGKMI